MKSWLVAGALIGASLGFGAGPQVSGRAACPAPDNEHRVAGQKECMAIRTFRPPSPVPNPILIVYLHGDLSDGSPADYIYQRAREAVADGRIVVAMLRPGYFDSEGNQSTGDNFDRNDSYTASNVDAVAAAIQTLREYHKASAVVVVGHSGGAAIAGVIIGRHPGLIDAAVLVACPCDVPAWRSGRRPWTRSLSPHDFVKKAPADAKVTVISGDRDDNVRPALAKAYADNLAKRGISARFILVPGAGHDDVMRKPELRAALDQLVR